jgi:hypothetical protein
MLLYFSESFDNTVEHKITSAKIAILHPYPKSSLTLNEWKFNLSFSQVSLLFLNSWRINSVVPYYATTHPPAIQKQH